MITELEEDNRKKLATVLASLDQLRRATAESNTKCTKMTEILTLFDDRLARLEETVQPVYKETGNLQGKQEASNEALAKLDYVIRFYKVAGEVELFIQQGLTPGAFDAYLTALDELARAHDYFIKNNPQSPELLNVHSLLERGGNNVEKEFRQLLQQNCNPIPVVSILDLIGQQPSSSSSNNDKTSKDTEKENKGGGGGGGEDSVKKAEPKFSNIEEITLPEKRRQQLRTLSAWLKKNRPKDFVTVYAMMRSEVLIKSLNNLWQYLRSASLSNVLSSNTNLGSIIAPLVGGQERLQITKLDTPNQIKRPSKLSTIETASTGVGPSGLIRKLPNFGGVVRTSTSMADLKEAMASEVVTDREIVTYIIAVTGLFKLMQLEYHFIGQSMESDRFRESVFSRVVGKSLDRIRTEGESLCARVKRCVQAKDFSSVLCLLPVYRYHTHMRHSFDMLLDGCDEDVQKRLHTLGVTLQTTISKALEEFIEYIKSDGAHSSRVPKDGTVHELTSNVMLFLINLQNYMDILSRVITSPDPRLLEDKARLGWDKNRLTFSQYIFRILSALGLVLMKKSEAYNSDSTLQALFRVNNIHYIVKTLHKAKMMDIVKMVNEEVEAHYMDRIAVYKDNYFKVWNRLLALLYEGRDANGAISQQKTIMSPQYQHQALPTSFSGYSLSSTEKNEFKLKDKQRQAIKEKFSSFNKEFESICTAQKSYAVPDVDLRQELTRGNKELIVEPYCLFYNKYVQLNFTKNVHKYIRYTPEHVAQMIQMFFDQAA